MREDAVLLVLNQMAAKVCPFPGLNRENVTVVQISVTQLQGNDWASKRSFILSSFCKLLKCNQKVVHYDAALEIKQLRVKLKKKKD